MSRRVALWCVCTALLSACSTVPSRSIASEVAALKAGTLRPQNFDFVELRFHRGGEGQRAFDDLVAWTRPEDGYIEAHGGPCANLTRITLWGWVTAVKNAADETTAADTSAALKNRYSELDAALETIARGDAPIDERLPSLDEARADIRNATNETVHDLFSRLARDQSIRFAAATPTYAARWQADLPEPAVSLWRSIAVGRNFAIDCDNSAWLAAQLESIVWFDIPTYGAHADAAAWHLAQHADYSPALQSLVLARLELLAGSGGTSANNFANLWDRVAINAQRPQKYGTQGRCANGHWAPFPSEDEANLDQRRRRLGLGATADTISEMNARNLCGAAAPAR